MNDNNKQQAWQRRCSQLEALGIDPYDPQFPADEERRLQVKAILKEYDVAIGNVIPVPPGWEGNPPLRAITSLADLADWLNDQWTSTLATEMGGETYKADALEQAARVVRNGFRLLAWFGVDDRPERPLPAETLAIAKLQLDTLERWVRQKVKDGWIPLEPSQPEEAKVSNAKTGKRRKRTKFPDEYEVNLLVHKYLSQNPGAPIRDVVEGVDLSQGKVQGTEAWQVEMARRKAAKPPPKIKERQLTRKMLAAIEQKDGPAVRNVIKNDAIWRWLLETAQPSERVGLHMKTQEQRADLIELSREQYDEEHAEPDD